MKPMKELFAGAWRAAKGYSGISSALTALFIAVLVVLNVAVYALAGHFGWYLQSVPKYTHQIGRATEQYFADLEQDIAEVKIRFCMQREELEADVACSLVHQTALQFSEKYDFIEVEYINIILDPDEVERYKYETDEETGEKKKVNSINKESVIIDGGRQFMVQHLSSFFNLDSNQVIEAYNGEETMAAMVHWVLTEEHPVAYFTTGHRESSNTSFYNLLVCAGYEVKMIDLSKENIPDGTSLVVIADPRYDFEKAADGSGIVSEIERLESFLASGGMLYVSLDSLVGRLPHLEALLEKWGMAREAATVRDMNQALSADGLALITSFPSSGVGKTVGERTGSGDSGRVVLKNAAPIKLSTPQNGATAQPILLSSPNANAYANGELVSGAGDYTLAALSRAEGGGSVFLVSSIYLAAHDAIETNGYANGDLLYALLEEANGATVPLGCTILPFDSQRLEGLSMGAVHRYALLLVLAVPAIVIGVGVAVRIRRKNR
jgi:hypothetical protein